MLCIIRNKADKFSGTCRNTLSAGFTCFLINYCDSVYYMDCIEGTYGYACTTTEASLSAGLGSACGYEINYAAILRSYVLVVLLSLFAIACACYEGNLLYTSRRFGSHDLSNLIANFSSAYGTAVYGSFALYDCSSKTGTSGISAASAVISGKSGQNLLFSFIYFYFENNTGSAEEQSYEYSDACCT